MLRSKPLEGEIKKGDRISWPGTSATVIRPPYGLFGKRVDFITDKTDDRTPVIATTYEKHFREAATRLTEPSACPPPAKELRQWPDR